MGDGGIAGATITVGGGNRDTVDRCDDGGGWWWLSDELTAARKCQLSHEVSVFLFQITGN